MQKLSCKKPKFFYSSILWGESMGEKKKAKLGARLSACAEFVSSGGVVADIGTDHAMLPVFLVESGKCRKAIASDIAQKPYEGALLFVKENNLADKIDVRLGAGLEKVGSDEVSDIVIAGMGGELIAQILEAAQWTRSSELSFVLQPMTKAAALRTWLMKNGFEILREKAVTDSGRDYTVMKCRYTGKKASPTGLEAYVGKLIPCESDSARRLLKKQADMLKNEAVGLNHNGCTDMAQQYTETAERLEKLSEE